MPYTLFVIRYSLAEQEIQEFRPGPQSKTNGGQMSHLIYLWAHSAYSEGGVEAWLRGEKKALIK